MISTRPQFILSAFSVRLNLKYIFCYIENRYLEKVDILNLWQHKKVDILHFVRRYPGS